MPKKSKHSRASVDILELLKGASARKREELLAPLGVKEFFVDGSVTINKRTCRGLECKLCIEACPTNALFWKAGEVGLIKELCVYCGACVLSCIVDDCIRVVRKRVSGEVESFSKPKDFTELQHRINTKKRSERIREVFPETQEYLKRYPKQKTK